MKNQIEHVCKPSCHNPCLLDEGNPYKPKIERAEPGRGAPSWSKTMAEVQPCGHTNAQHLYHDSGDIKIDLSACVASGPPSTGQASGGVTAGVVPTASAAPEPSRGAPEANSAHQHHWNKYHNLDKATAFMGGEFYLGGECQSCEFGVSDRIAESGHVVLLEALRACVEWEADYRARNHLGQNAPHPFKQAEAAIKQAERT